MRGTSEMEMELEEDTQKGKYLTFTLGDTYYGLDIECVTEIIGMQPITVVPELPVFVKGIINLRGKIIPVMDIRIKFKKKEKSYSDRTCIIIIDIQDISIGLIVDAVAEVLDIDDDQIVPPPKMNEKGNKYIKGVGKNKAQVILLLDCGRILSEDETSELLVCE